MEIAFHKYQGSGNDFIMIDNRTGDWAEKLSVEKINFLCDRRFGIGADGLILLSQDEKSDFRMVYFNADGNESSMCGNGGRCIIAFARQVGIERDQYHFRAIDGPHYGRIIGEEVELHMSRPSGYKELGPDSYWIDTGSPHYVAFTQRQLADLDMNREGAAIRHDPAFAPGGTNVNFVHEIHEHFLAVRTFERGVEAETLSCGTGVTACAYIQLKKLKQPSGSILLNTPGGQLSVQVEDLGTEREKVLLKGPAKHVFSGVIR